MQFIFGDNTSKYTMLFFDDKADNAGKIKDMVRLPYSPNPDFDAFGFIPFGINNNRALFFKFQKDTKMVRNVYLLHGVYTDPDPDYFFSDEYVNGIFTGFINQEQFDSLRDAQLAGEKNLSVPYSCQTSLASTPNEQISIDPIKLHEIVSKLYQRLQVVIVMDDEKFNNDTVRLLIKKIFSLLTPSLRKVCSYITAVDNTGDMEFLLRIIPRSMMQKDEAVIDLDASSSPYVDKNGFSEIGKALLALSEDERSALFDTFELLHYGKDSIYRKQNLQSFFECYTAKEYSDEIIAGCDKILGEYLGDTKCPDDPTIPMFLQKALFPIYSSDRMMDGLIDWEKAELEKIDSFYEDYIDSVKKYYYLCNKELTYFENKLNTLYLSPCNGKDIDAIKALCSRIAPELFVEEDGQPPKKQLLLLASKCYDALVSLYTEYDKAYESLKLAITGYIQNRYFDARIGSIKDVMYRAISMALESTDLSTKILDIEEHFATRLQEECVDTHNAEYDRKVECARCERERASRELTLSEFIALLEDEEIQKKEAYEKELAEKREAEKAKKQKKTVAADMPQALDEFEVFSDFDEPAAEENPNPDVTAQDADNTDAQEEGATTPKKELRVPGYEELLAVAEDPDLADKLSNAMASYLLNVCLMKDEPDFPFNDHLISKIDHEETTVLVSKQLCDKGHPEFAILYIAAYCPSIERIFDIILNMEEASALKNKQTSLIQKLLPAILEEKSLDFVLEEDVQNNYITLAEQLCANKDVAKARKALCKLLLASPFLFQKGKKTKKFSLDGINKKAVIIIAIVDVVVLAIIALVVAIIIAISGGDSSKTTDEPGAPNSVPTPSETVTAQSQTVWTQNTTNTF